MIGIIGAMKIETYGLMEKLTDVKKTKKEKFEFCYGKLDGKEVVVCCCGIGKVNSAAAAVLMINLYPEIDLIMSIGVAGGLHPSVKQGDIVIGEKTVYHDFDATADGVEKGRVSGYDFTYFHSDSDSVKKIKKIVSDKGIRCFTGVIATGDRFVCGDELSANIRAAFGADACDMESAAVAQAAYLMNRKFVSMRAISDNGDGSAIGDFYSFVVKASRICIEVIERFVKESRIA